MDRVARVPDGVDTERPSAARVYDYLLGGSHNFAVDREAAHQLLTLMPDAGVQAQANRAFLYRAVRHLLDAGVRQLLDLGSGVPTVGNVHEVAQRRDPATRVVYVDIDPIAVAHSRALLGENQRAAVIQEDLRRPEAILNHPEVRRLLDFGQPVGLLLVAILHAIPNADDPYRIVETLKDALSPGSYLVISHATADSMPELYERFRVVSARSGNPVTARPHPDVVRFFEGFTLLDPGVVWAPLWRPEDPSDVGKEPERCCQYAGVGRKV